MRSVSILAIVVILLSLLAGCATKEPIIRTEYIRVEVPVVYKLERPSRPEFTSKKSTPGYTSEVLNYSEMLEVIIDEHNTKGTNQ